AGLIWLRGLVEHHGAEVQAAIWTARPTYVRVNGEWKEAEVRVRRAGRWEPTNVQVAHVGWPKRSDLPVGKAEKNGRDVAYDQFVAKRRIREPLGWARNFIATV